ncbi:GGDEF domain-containing protein [Celerinatantimonas yamalensis]|uniref:Sensor domain-containing diguanylate cyclase n=1 Tax=Celerinatantimonas yamalensis TaxID=559956 RepID=A0ABW9G4H9_9GAMM
MKWISSTTVSQTDEKLGIVHPTSENSRFLAVLEGCRSTYWEYHLHTQKLHYLYSIWEQTTSQFISYQTSEDFQALQANIHPSDRASFYAQLNLHIEKVNPVFECTFRYLTAKNRRWRWFRCRGHITHYQDNEPAVIAGIFRDVTREKYRQQKLRQMAKRDPLTGLPNRAALKEDFDQHRPDEHQSVSMAIFYLDLDGFKEVNDKINHRAGDVLLCDLANQLNCFTRLHEKVYRIGGDEFVLFVPRFSNIQEITHLAERITHTFANNKLTISGYSIQVGISIGIATYRTSDTLDSILERADARMYEVKNNGKNGYKLGHSLNE